MKVERYYLLAYTDNSQQTLGPFDTEASAIACARAIRTLCPDFHSDVYAQLETVHTKAYYILRYNVKDHSLAQYSYGPFTTYQDAATFLIERMETDISLQCHFAYRIVHN